ncbi:MAG: sugar transferase [Synergistaceae bacterium]|nr:sugar transferase [Synergistaceae bacterium]
MLKRIFDILFSFTAIVFLSPVFIALYFMIRKRMGAPVLYLHERAGMNGKPFVLYKFRSMTDEKTKGGELLPDSERLTPFGKKLRKYSLDELPQFYNVLKGDMSVVGPRPLLLEYVPKYNEKQRIRLNVKPGVTGWAQVNGRNAISWENKFELDTWYVENRSFYLDCKIIVKTILKVFKSEGISATNEATMPKFTGSEENGKNGE